MFVDEKTGTNTYTPVTGTLFAGTIVRLRIEYDRGNSFVGKIQSRIVAFTYT